MIENGETVDRRYNEISVTDVLPSIVSQESEQSSYRRGRVDVLSVAEEISLNPR